jgi:hypothetical protein
MHWPRPFAPLYRGKGPLGIRPPIRTDWQSITLLRTTAMNTANLTQHQNLPTIIWIRSRMNGKRASLLRQGIECSGATSTHQSDD